MMTMLAAWGPGLTRKLGIPAGWLGVGAGCGACPRRLLGGRWSTSITSMCSSSESLESEADGCRRLFSSASLPPSSCPGSLLGFVDCPACACQV